MIKRIARYALRRVDRIRQRRQAEAYESVYGALDWGQYDDFTVRDLPCESTFYWGEVIKWSADTHPRCVLFAGENRATAAILREKINAGRVLTAGLSDDVDYRWDFEEEPPSIQEEVDLIVSQAIFEHLLNPFQHLCDLSRLVAHGGHIVVHTHTPGFPYHRYPIDALRFFPDWFEESADRLGLTVVRRRVRENFLFYMYRKA
jgi:SAM-dependent methyltransferase